MIISPNTRAVETLCGFCPSRCGIVVHVKDEKVIRVEGSKKSVTSGLCVKGAAIPDYFKNALPERLQYPLKKTEHGWEVISWDQALEIISEKLREIKENYGPQSLAVFTGGESPQLDYYYYATRFCDLYGTPNYSSMGSFCFYAGAIASYLTYGYYSIAPNYQNTKCAVIWGSNPTHTLPSLSGIFYDIKKQGAKLLVVDPRRTELAELADLHIQIRPGTDCALALSVLNVIISEKLYDEKFVNEWTFGFEKLREHVKKYSPEKVEESTFIPAEKIREFAEIYANSKPAVINTGVSLEHQVNGVQTLRAILILIAITGNLDVPGGNMFWSMPPFKNLRLDKKSFELNGVGVKEFPIFYEIFRESLASSLTETLLTEKPYPVKAMIIQQANPALMWPHSQKVKEALKRLELLVVHDVFMTPTAKLAHIILPAANFLEKTELYVKFGLPLLNLQNKVFEPPTECWAEWQFWFKLAEKMGFNAYFPWKNSEEAINTLLEPLGCSVEYLRNNPRGFFYQPKASRRYEIQGFKTPSGKVEIFSKKLEDLGLDPIPQYIDPDESSKFTDEDKKEYPLILTNSRVKVYLHSQHRNIPSLSVKCPEPKIEINTNTARKLGINDNDEVVVESPIGSIKIKAHTTLNVHPKVVSMPIGWSQANVNILTDHLNRDPISGFPAFKFQRCKIKSLEF
jgi:anaerobic selenocysteine-containing dehydrogenase